MTRHFLERMKKAENEPLPPLEISRVWSQKVFKHFNNLPIVLLREHLFGRVDAV